MQNTLLSGNPVAAMLRFSLPVFFGSILTQLLSFLDSLLLGRMAGISAFASVSASGAALMPVMGLAMGIAAGSVIPLTIRYGGGKPGDIHSSAAGARALVNASSAVLLILAELLALPLLRLTGTPEDILPGAIRFCRVALLSLPLSARTALNSGILRATGNARAAARYQVLAALVNLPLDAIFLAAGAGESGVAAGGVIAQAIAAVSSHRAVTAHPLFSETGRAERQDVVRSLRTALPVCLQFSAGSLSGMAFQSMVNARGSLAVATIAAAERTLGMLSLPARITGGSVEVFAGQNLGAGRPDRARKGVRDMALALFAFGLPISLAACLFGEKIVGLILREPAPLLSAYLAINALFLPFDFVCGALRNALQGLGRPGLAALAGVADLAVRLLIAAAGRGSLRMLLMAQPVSVAVNLLVLLAVYFPVTAGTAPADTAPPRAAGRRTPEGSAPLPRPGTPG